MITLDMLNPFKKNISDLFFFVVAGKWFKQFDLLRFFRGIVAAAKLSVLVGNEKSQTLERLRLH